MKRYLLPLAVAIPLSACQTNDENSGSTAKDNRVSCLVSVGSTSGKRYAALKCSKLSDPYNVSVQGTVWENKDKKEFQNMAKIAGRRFTCSTENKYTRADSGMRTMYVGLNNCK